MTTDDLKNAIVALMVAGGKMEAALNQCNVRPHVLAEWRAVVHAIQNRPCKTTSTPSPATTGADHSSQPVRADSLQTND